MAQFSSSTVSIKGIAACVPKKTESNNDYTYIAESERKLLIKTTGIEFRRVAEKGVTGSDVCYEAAEKLIADLGWDKSEIELLVYVSQSRDYFAPSTATILQDRLGLPKSTIAFDSGLGCSGYVYGLSMISAYLNMTKVKKALLLVGDISTFSLTPFDKSTYPLFGDAGTATALEYDETASQMFYSLGTDGSGYEAIILPGGCLRNPYDEEMYKMVEVEKGITRSKGNIWLKGLDVFTFSVTVIPPSLKELMVYANETSDSIDYFIMHQANLLMNETIRKKLKIAPEKVPYSLRDFGNTSSASIPLTIVTQLNNELSNVDKNKTMLLSGFGVGLSWASVILNTSSIHCSKLIEI
jgi:3-oxoacyl-[acyl-carrier-protein] synthase III